jgi:hypothetical protein
MIHSANHADWLTINVNALNCIPLGPFRFREELCVKHTLTSGMLQVK